MLWTALLLLTALSPRSGAGFPNGRIPDGDAGRSAGLDPHGGTDCGPCVVELCPEVRGCRAGVVPDRCGCCAECGNMEGQPCDLGNSSTFYGLCGAGLRCALDLRDLRYGDVLEPQCLCVSEEAVCATDGTSYANVCQLTAAAVSKPGLRVESSGPCRAVPLIKVPPRNLVNVTGSSVIFMCEVFAFPMALIEWRKDGNDAVLPGDDPHISVQSRGGPMRYELSSWLQIEGVTVGDAGTYRCVAQNQLGSVSASAALAVLEPGETSAFSSEDLPAIFGYDRQREYDEDYY
ncbi:kazal-type serine protease inhibitor domain-containing protein 1-like [Arapaima gigas]